MNKKWNLVLATVAVAALAACGKKEAAAPAASAEAVVKIGHVAPTSGAIAHLGKDNENGA
ncbi:MAG: branched-chain amino acid ABC transporter substrate-binding protein, partial [Betaproteobacteria bacterium]